MKPISSVYNSVFVTAAILLSGAFFAAQLPATASSELQESPTDHAVESAAIARGTGLVVEITNVRSGDGKVVVFVFDDRHSRAWV